MKWLIVCSVMAMAAYTMTQEVKEKREVPYSPAGGKFLLGVVRTQVISSASTTTISVAASTCQNGVATTTCSGRKKRMALPELPEVNPGKLNEELGSSLKEDNEESADESKDGLQKLVIWTTSTVILTFTSSATASGTTLSLSYYCTASGMSVPSACG